MDVKLPRLLYSVTAHLLPLLFPLLFFFLPPCLLLSHALLLLDTFALFLLFLLASSSSRLFSSIIAFNALIPAPPFFFAGGGGGSSSFFVFFFFFFFLRLPHQLQSLHRRLHLRPSVERQQGILQGCLQGLGFGWALVPPLSLWGFRGLGSLWLLSLFLCWHLMIRVSR
jgi:hypothetical protein